MLIKNGANVNSLDYQGFTPLHIASKRGHHNIAIILLSSGADPNTPGHRMKTPLHKASSQEMVRLLLRHGADPLAKYCGKNLQYGVPVHTVFEKMLSRHSHTCKALMNSCIDTNGHELESNDLLIVYDLGMFQNESISVDDKSNEMAAHSKLIQSNDIGLLTHPISELMLHLKKKRVFKYFFANALLYGIFLLSLTILAFLQTMFLKDYDQEDAKINGVTNTTHYHCSYNDDWRYKEHPQKCHFWYDKHLRHEVFGSHKLRCGMMFLNPLDDCTDGPINGRFVSFYFFYFLTLLSSLILLVVEWLKFCYASNEYFRTKRYIIEILVLVSTLGYLIGMFLFSRVINLHLGAWSVFMAWINMTVLLGHFPGIGVYMFMFKYVTQTIIIFVLVYAPLLIAFAFGFYLLLPRNSSFNDPFTSVLKVLSMMIGELDYTDTFAVDRSREESDWTIGSIQIIYTLFVVLVSIIIHNLILALTVNEVDVLFKRARSIQLEHLVRQVITIMA